GGEGRIPHSPGPRGADEDDAGTEAEPRRGTTRPPARGARGRSRVVLGRCGTAGSNGRAPGARGVGRARGAECRHVALRAPLTDCGRGDRAGGGPWAAR